LTTFDFTKLLNEAKAAGGAMPIGDYPMEVTRAEAVTASTGKSMIKTWLRVFEGPHSNATMVNNFVLTIDNANALAFFFQHMRAFGLDDSFFVGLGQNTLAPAAAALVGRRAIVTVGHREWQGRKQPQVNGVQPYGGPGVVPIPMPGVALPGMVPTPMAQVPSPTAPQPTLPGMPMPPVPQPTPGMPTPSPILPLPQQPTVMQSVAPVAPVAPLAVPAPPPSAAQPPLVPTQPQAVSVSVPAPAPAAPQAPGQALPPGMTQEMFDAIKASNPALAEQLLRSVAGNGAPQAQTAPAGVPTAPPPLPI